MSKPFDTGELEHGVAQLCADARQVIAPIEESARGYRDALVSGSGWDPENAETIAMTYFHFVSMMFLKGVSQAQVEMEQDDDD